MDLKELKTIFLKPELFTSIVGQERVKNQMKSALISGRHLVLIGPPGVGKTTLVKDVADLLPKIKVNDCGFNCIPGSDDKLLCPECRSAGKNMKAHDIEGLQRFVRVQGSPDLTAEDLIGDIDPMKAMKFGPLSVEAFTPGKIFKANNGILFFDEVNRCSEKLQNALLQVLEERKATIGSYDVDFNANFIFIGTMNPKDFSTENLSDVFMDRFDLVNMGYPETLKMENEIVKMRAKPLVKLSEKQNSMLFDMIVSFTRSLRNSKKLERFPSVRATIGLVERTQANALVAGRTIMKIVDFKEAMDSVLAHRIKLKPSVKYLQSPMEVLEEEFKSFTKANNIDTESMSVPQEDSEKEASDSG